MSRKRWSIEEDKLLALLLRECGRTAAIHQEMRKAGYPRMPKEICRRLMYHWRCAQLHGSLQAYFRTKEKINEVPQT